MILLCSLQSNVDRKICRECRIPIQENRHISACGFNSTLKRYIFVLARQDVFPVEDLGIRNGMEALYGEQTRAEMVAHAEQWRPYRSLASLYLWRVVD